MKNLKFTIISLFCLFSINILLAQDDIVDTHTLAITIPAVALVDIETTTATKDLTFAFETQPSAALEEAGLPLKNPDPNTDLWINYSSIQAGTTAKKITVRVNNLFAGVDIKVLAAADAAAGDGALGTSSLELTLTEADQDIITGIGSAYTGDGNSSGHNLTYTLGFATSGVAEYEDLRSGVGTPITVTYTIADE